MSSRHPVEAWEACEDPLHESILLFILFIYLKWDVAGCLLLLVNVILTGYVLATVLLCCSNQVPAGCAAAVDTTEQVQWLRFWQPFFRHLGHYNHVVNGASNSNVASRA